MGNPNLQNEENLRNHVICYCLNTIMDIVLNLDNFIDYQIFISMIVDLKIYQYVFIIFILFLSYLWYIGNFIQGHDFSINSLDLDLALLKSILYHRSCDILFIKIGQLELSHFYHDMEWILHQLIILLKLRCINLELMSHRLVQFLLYHVQLQRSCEHDEDICKLQ